MGPFQTTTFKDSADLDKTHAILRGMSCSGLAVQVVAAGMNDGRPTLVTEPYMPLPGGDAIARAIIDASRRIASQSTYNDSDIHRAAATIHPHSTATGFLKKMLAACISLDRQGSVMNGFTIVQAQTPSGIEWRVAGGNVQKGLGNDPFPVSNPVPSSQNITRLVDFLRNGVESGKIPDDLFSLRQNTILDPSSEDRAKSILQALIPGATVTGRGEDGIVFQIGAGKVMKAWHGNGHDDMAEWQNGTLPEKDAPLNRPNIEIMSLSLLQASDAKHLVPELSTYGFIGPFRGLVRSDLNDVELPLLGFDHDHSYLSDVLALAERLSYPETDPRRPDMSDDDISDELALIVAMNEIEEGADHGDNDPFMGREFLDNMTIFFREARRLGIVPDDMNNASNYGVDEDGNLRLRDLSRFALGAGMDQNGHGVYPGGYILPDVIAHGAKEEGLIQTITPELSQRAIRQPSGYTL